MLGFLEFQLRYFNPDFMSNEFGRWEFFYSLKSHVSLPFSKQICFVQSLNSSRWFFEKRFTALWDSSQDFGYFQNERFRLRDYKANFKQFWVFYMLSVVHIIFIRCSPLITLCNIFWILSTKLNSQISKLRVQVLPAVRTDYFFKHEQFWRVNFYCELKS